MYNINRSKIYDYCKMGTKDQVKAYPFRVGVTLVIVYYEICSELPHEILTIITNKCHNIILIIKTYMDDIKLDVNKEDNVASNSMKLNIKRKTNIWVRDGQKIIAILIR